MIRTWLMGTGYKCLYSVVAAADRWVHFHRFNARIVCDCFDRVNGAPWHVIRSYRKKPAHTPSRSYLRHPSHVETVDG